MFKTNSAKRGSKGVRGDLEELVSVLRTYVAQEIVGPLRGLGRFIGFGLAGSLFVSLSVLLGGMGLLRLLQAEVSVFSTNWSFVPYLITAVALLIILAATLRVVSGRDSDSPAATSPDAASPAAASPASEKAPS